MDAAVRCGGSEEKKVVLFYSVRNAGSSILENVPDAGIKRQEGRAM